MSKRLLLPVLVALIVVPGGAWAQSPQDLVAKLEPGDQEKLKDYFDRVLDELNVESADAEAAVEAQTRVATSEALKVTGNQPGIVGAPTGFGTRLNDLLTNFQPIFGFAVNAINTADEDDAVSVDFNPVRVGRYGAVKIAATVSEPKASDALIEEVVESSRETQRSAIEDELGVFEDITWSLTYGYQRGSGEDWRERRRLWGRHPKLYEGFTRTLFDEAWKRAWESASGDRDEIFVRIYQTLVENEATAGLAAGNLLALTFEQAESLANVDRVELATVLVEQAIRHFELDRAFAAIGIRSLSDLIDDQPTATFTAAYRNRDDFIGQDTASATFKLEFGRFNVNKVRKEIARRGSLVDAFTYVVSERQSKPKDRFSLVVNYKWLDDLEIDYPYLQEVTDPETGGVTNIDQVATLAIDDSTEISGKLAYSRSIERQAVTIEGVKIPPRVDLSIEYVYVDDEMRQERWIGQLAYNIPLAPGLSLPVTLTYASNPEFLGEQDEEFSAHLGLSYGFNRLFE